MPRRFKLYIILILISALTTFAQTPAVLQNALDLGHAERMRERFQDFWIVGIRYEEIKNKSTLPSALLSPDLFENLPEKEKVNFRKIYPVLHSLEKQWKIEKKFFTEKYKLVPKLDKDRITHKSAILDLIKKYHSQKLDLPYSTIDHLLGIRYNEVEAKASGKYSEAPETIIGMRRSFSQTSYNLIRDVFINLKVPEGAVFYDLGSGFGRVLTYGAILRPDVKFIGIEYVAERAQEANRVAQEFGISNAFTKTGDVLKADFSDGAFFFLFNPFPSIMDQVLGRLKAIGKKKRICIIALGITYPSMRMVEWLKQESIVNAEFPVGVFCNKR